MPPRHRYPHFIGGHVSARQKAALVAYSKELRTDSAGALRALLEVLRVVQAKGRKRRR